MNKHFNKISVLSAAIGLVLSSGAFAAETASHNVNVTVSEINEITVNQTAVDMTINGSSDTEGLNRVQTETSSWGVYTNRPVGDKMTVSAILDEVVGTGLTLKVNVEAPSNGTSADEVELTDAAVEVVTGIYAVDEIDSNPLTLTYKLYATKLAEAGYTNTVQVTYTIADDGA